MNGMHAVCVGSLMVVLSGCSTTTGESHGGIYTTGADIMKAKELALPANYDPNNLDRHLQMSVAVERCKGITVGDVEGLLVNPDLSLRLQTELNKLNRFKIHARYGTTAQDVMQEIADVGGKGVKEAAQEKEDDLTLNIKMTATKERQRKEDRNVWYFTVECDCTCVEAETQTTKFSEKFRGTAEREQLISTRDRRLVGFDEKTEQDALLEASLKALANLSIKLGNTFPVGGHVTGMTPSGETMMFDRGFKDGIFKNQQTVVYVDYMGVDIPIAAGTAEPGKDKSRLAIRRWNDANKDAKAVADELRRSPAAFFKNYKTYAVGYGINIPPEWETFDQRK